MSRALSIGAAGAATPAVLTFDRSHRSAAGTRAQAPKPWAKGRGKAMALNDVEFLDHEVGVRWAQSLRQRYPGRDVAKRIARDFDCAVRTATGWLEGQHPQLKHFRRAVALHGEAIVTEVLFPDTRLDDRAQRLAALTEIERRLADLGSALAALRADMP